MSISSGGDAARRPPVGWACRAFAGLACLIASLGCRPAEEAQISLDPSARFQTISGWEAAAEIDGPPREHGSPPWADEMLDRAVDDIGINRTRLEIRSGVESRSGGWRRYSRGEIPYEAWRPIRYATQNDNDDPFLIDPTGFDFSEMDLRVETVVLPLAKRLKARGERLYVNLCYVSFIAQGKDLPYHHDAPEEYAEFMLAAFEHLKAKYDLTPDGIEVILEPDLTPFWSQDGGAKIAAAIEATARRLEAAGFRPEFIAPSVTNMTNALPYLEQILKNPTARERIAEFSYHRYQGASRERAQAIAALARSHGKRAAMLEYWLGNGRPEILFEDLTDGEASAWQGRVVSGHFEVVQEEGRHSLRIQPEVRFNRIVFRAVRAGAERIGAASSNPAFQPLAFEHADGGLAVVIKADAPGEVAVNVPPGSYLVEMALDGLFLSWRAEADGDAVKVNFPSAGYASLRTQRDQP